MATRESTAGIQSLSALEARNILRLIRNFADSAGIQRAGANEYSKLAVLTTGVPTELEIHVTNAPAGNAQRLAQNMFDNLRREFGVTDEILARGGFAAPTAVPGTADRFTIPMFNRTSTTLPADFETLQRVANMRYDNVQTETGRNFTSTRAGLAAAYEGLREPLTNFGREVVNNSVRVLNATSRALGTLGRYAFAGVMGLTGLIVGSGVDKKYNDGQVTEAVKTAASDLIDTVKEGAKTVGIEKEVEVINEAGQKIWGATVKKYDIARDKVISNIKQLEQKNWSENPNVLERTGRTRAPNGDQ